MSWQAYVDNNLVGTGNLTFGAILGHDGSVWAKSATLNISGPEAQTLARSAFTPGVQGTGLTVAGKKYLTLKTDERSFYGKQGTGGIVAVKTTQSVLVGIYETQQPGAATTTVEKLADYLINSGY